MGPERRPTCQAEVKQVERSTDGADGQCAGKRTTGIRDRLMTIKMQTTARTIVATRPNGQVIFILLERCKEIRSR